jgi:hypothetical protein
MDISPDFICGTFKMTDTFFPRERPTATVPSALNFKELIECNLEKYRNCLKSDNLDKLKLKLGFELSLYGYTYIGLVLIDITV